MTESFAELFEQSQSALSKLKPGAIVSGVVVEVRNDVVVINAGLKSEGIIPIEQFRNEAGELEIAVGETVKVALEYLENGFGETVLSREKAKRAMVWDELEASMEAGEIVTGRISGKVKGGFTVDIRDVRAFLPGSLVDVRPVRDPGYLEGKELEFKIIKLDRKRNNVVVSRRAGQVGPATSIPIGRSPYVQPRNNNDRIFRRTVRTEPDCPRQAEAGCNRQRPGGGNPPRRRRDQRRPQVRGRGADRAVP